MSLHKSRMRSVAHEIAKHIVAAQDSYIERGLPVPMQELIDIFDRMAKENGFVDQSLEPLRSLVPREVDKVMAMTQRKMIAA